MPTRRVELIKDHLAEAKEAAEARTYTSRDPLIFAHVGEKGLQLRVQDSTASWVLKFNGSSKSLGKLSQVTTIKAAVERAQHVRAIMKRGEKPDEYLKSLNVSKDHDKATADAESRKARADGAWTWKQLAEAYRENYLSQPRTTKQGIKPPSAKSVQDFIRYTSTPHHAKHLDDLLVRDMTPELVEKIRNLTRGTNGPNAGRKVVQWISAALSWGQEEHKLHTGLGTGFAWWKGVSPGYTPPTRGRYLDLEQIASVLYIAEKHRDRPDRLQAKPTTEAALAALWWIVLTAQRTTASMSLLASRVVDDKDARGWKIAAFPAEDMKSKRYHALPLPPRVVLLLERARIGVDRNSKWAFPSKKVRRPGSDEIEDLHIHDTTVNLMIRRLRGKDTVGKKRESVDLLEGIPHFSPHDLRRSLTTILTDLKVRGDAASAVLDHSSGTPGEVEFQEADITRLAYNRSQRIELKREAMEAWTTAVFDAVEKEWAKHRPFPFKALRQVLPLGRVLDVGHGDGIPQKASSQTPLWYQKMESKEAMKKSEPRPRLSELRKSSDE
ncbi:tyrosine-type recombinase/integrase [Mesorhizobium sp. ESP7-2]|uniref:tyrosine-type recombinase/integrase n=1 Tax=Mesorhizobium sp. ESP7-2 TaxID=2876622 RepID=UPI001CCA0844|nr:tyrosine-type recombinase/integrase [Mesorhizobium sp. ESP7-2]MBZ9705339.1 tyrosine-type recombinase/integrase [Mesorhizobium sp. ESP7-2]